jgi:hypothetical protein
MLADSVDRVMRTAGIKTAAVAEQWTDRPAVCGEQGNQQPAEHDLFGRLFVRFALQLAPQLIQQLMQGGVIQQAKTIARQYDGVNAAGRIDQLVLLVTKSFSGNALDAIALGGAPHGFFRYHNAETGMIELIGACEYQQFFGRNPQRGCRKYLLVIEGRQQTRGFSKRKRRHCISIEIGVYTTSR